MTTGTAFNGIDTITARLVARYGAALPASVVGQVVEESFASLGADATVSSYLPILAERMAAERLAVLSRFTPHTVEFRGGAQQFLPAVAAAAGERWQAVPRNGDVVVVTPRDPWSPTEVVVIADTRPAPPPHEVVTAYERGATAYVNDAVPAILVAHLDAVARGTRRLRQLADGDRDVSGDGVLGSVGCLGGAPLCDGVAAEVLPQSLRRRRGWLRRKSDRRVPR